MITDWLKQPKKFLNDKKTYIAVGVTLVLGVLEGLELWTVPSWLWPILGAFGFGFMRAGVQKTKNETIQTKNFIKEIIMNSTKVILIAAMILCMTGGPLRAEGLSIWGMTEQNIDSRNNAIVGRIGYEYDFIEPFLSSTWLPNYDAEADEIDPPQIFSFGTLVHMRDLLDPDNPLPWIPQLLLTYIPEDALARPYFGFQGTINIFDQDAGHTSFITGIMMQMKEGSRSSFVFESHLLNQFFDDMSAVPDDEWRFYFGARYYFGR